MAAFRIGKLSKDPLHNFGMLAVILFVFSMSIRLIFLLTKKYDYWGDSYHHLYTSWMTFQNLGYSDIKSNHVFWLPGYHVFGMLLVPFSKQPNLFPFQLANVLLGSFSTVLVADIVYRIYENKYYGIVSGMLLSIFSTHLVYSSMNMPEIFAGTALLIMIRSLHLSQELRFYLSYFICITTRYELWIIVNIYIILFLLRFEPKFSKKRLSIVSGVIFSSWIIIWTIWSYIHTTNLLYWLTSQSTALKWDMRFFGKLSTYQIVSLYINPVMLLVIGSTIIQVIAKGLKKYWISFPFSSNILIIIFTRFLLNILLNLVPLYDLRYLLLDFHLVVLLGPNVIQISQFTFQRLRNLFIRVEKLDTEILRKNTILMKGTASFLPKVITLLIIGLLIFSQVRQIEVYQNKEYVIVPEADAGLFLQDWIIHHPMSTNPLVLTDSPVVAYYAKLSPTQIVPSEAISHRSVVEYIRSMNIPLLVYQEVSFSNFSNAFPFLESHPENIIKDSITYSLIYNYTGWELQYGADNVWIYTLQFY